MVKSRQRVVLSHGQGVVRVDVLRLAPAPFQVLDPGGRCQENDDLFLAKMGGLRGGGSRHNLSQGMDAGRTWKGGGRDRFCAVDAGRRDDG